MPRTLWRYIFLETLRLVLLSSTVLVTVIAFAVTVKPLADGQITGAQAISFMFFAVPPMLAYAIPFAAGFGTTLAYYRLADENEIIAAKASGLSYRNILAPAVAIGLLLAGSVWVLNDQIIPRFLTRMERMITQDLTQVMVNQLGSGQSAVFGNAEIHADSVLEFPRTKDSPYERTVRLSGLVAIETNQDGEIVLEATSSTAWLLVFKGAALSESQREGFDPEDLIAKIVFDDGQVFDGRGYVDLANYESQAVPLPSAFDDDPKFLTGAQLARLEEHPESISFIESRRMDLGRSLATAQTIRSLVRKAESTGQLVFNAPADRTLFITTNSLEWNALGYWDIIPADGQRLVEIEEQTSDGTITRSHAEIARLFPQSRTTSDSFFNQTTQSNSVSLRFRLELQDIQIGTSTGDSRIAATTQVAEDVIQDLAIDDDPMPRFASLSSAALLTQAEAYAGQDDITARAAILSKAIDKLGREVLSKQHERYAMAASCFVMVLAGAVMALKLKDKMPLIIYLWSFFPALATIVLISSGQSTTHRNGIVGVPFIWSGVIGLGAYTLITLRILARR